MGMPAVVRALGKTSNTNAGSKRDGDMTENNRKRDNNENTRSRNRKNNKNATNETRSSFITRTGIRIRSGR